MKRILLLVGMILCIGTTAFVWCVPASATFLSQDEFTTDRGNGTLINGSAAEPGPGNRVATDAEAKASITGAKLSFSGGKAAPANGDPGVWEAALTRAAGKMLITNMTVTDATAVTEFGFDTAATGAISEAGLRITADTLKPYVAGVAWPTIYVPADATNYSYATILRAAGAHYFIKPTDGFWRLLWSGITTNTATLYPGISNYSAVSVYDYLRVPSTLWLPTPLTSDGFSAATSDGLGHAETTGLGSGGSGKTWSGATWTVAGGVAYNTPTTGAEMWDAPAAAFTSGVYHWLPYGTNTCTNTSGELIVTFGSNQYGCYEELTNAADLNADTSGDNWYLLSFDSKVNSGYTYKNMLYNGANRSAALSNTNYARYSATFRGVEKFTSFELVAGSVVNYDNFSLLPLSKPTLFKTIDEGTANVVVDVKLGAKPSLSQAGMVFNLDSTSAPLNYILVYYDGTFIRADEIVNGGNPTAKMSVSYAWIAGTILRAVRDGTELWVYVWNGTTWAQVGTTQTMTANTNTRHGLFSTAAANTLDNYTCYARGNEGQYAVLTGLQNDTYPTQFTFTDVTNAQLSTDYISNAITVAGIDLPNTISITGGTYSKNGGAYTADDGTVVVTDQVTVKATSSSSLNTAVNAVLTTGTVSDTYTVTTGNLTSILAASGTNPVMYIAEGTYVGDQLGSDGTFSIDSSGASIIGLGTVLLKAGSTAEPAVNFTVNSSNSSITNVNVEVQDKSGDNGGIYVNSTGTTISHCDITCVAGAHVGWNFTGVHLNGTNSTVSYCDISGVRNGVAINSGAVVAIVENNIIHDLWAGTDSSSDGIIFWGAQTDHSGSIVRKNIIHGYKDDGIDLFWGSNILVDGNEIYSGVDWTADGADGNGIKCGNSDILSTGNIIKNNYIHDIAYGYGIGSNCSDNLIIAYNVVINVPTIYSGVGIDACSDGASVYNNTVIVGTGGADALKLGTGITGAIIVQNNILSKGTIAGHYDFDAKYGAVIGGYNMLVNDSYVYKNTSYINTNLSDKYATDPLFVSASDFHLQATSLAIGAGVAIPGLTTDNDGNIVPNPIPTFPDIGAYEYRQIIPMGANF